MNHTKENCTYGLDNVSILELFYEWPDTISDMNVGTFCKEESTSLRGRGD